MDCSYKIWLDLQSKPLHPNISIYVLYTLLDTFPLVLTRRIWVLIKAFMVQNLILFFFVILMNDLAILLLREITFWFIGLRRLKSAVYIAEMVPLLI